MKTYRAQHFVLVLLTAVALLTAACSGGDELVDPVGVDTNLDGTYAQRGDSGTARLEIIQASKPTIVAVLENFSISEELAYTNNQIIGYYTVNRQHTSSGEEIYIVTMQSTGFVQNSKGEQFPASLAITGFKSSDGQRLTTQWAAAYMKAGNAEEVNGGFTYWEKVPTSASDLP